MLFFLGFFFFADIFNCVLVYGRIFTKFSRYFYREMHSEYSDNQLSNKKEKQHIYRKNSIKCNIYTVKFLLNDHILINAHLLIWLPKMAILHVSEICIPRSTPLLYSKTWVCRGMPIFLIFAPKYRLWVLVRTAMVRRF